MQAWNNLSAGRTTKKDDGLFSGRKREMTCRQAHLSAGRTTKTNEEENVQAGTFVRWTDDYDE